MTCTSQSPRVHSTSHQHHRSVRIHTGCPTLQKFNHAACFGSLTTGSKLCCSQSHALQRASPDIASLGRWHIARPADPAKCGPYKWVQTTAAAQNAAAAAALLLYCAAAAVRCTTPLCLLAGWLLRASTAQCWWTSQRTCRQRRWHCHSAGAQRSKQRLFHCSMQCDFTTFVCV